MTVDMDKSHIDELKELKDHYKNELSKLNSSYRKWELAASQVFLTDASMVDVIEEDRLGQKSENNILAAAKVIANKEQSELKIYLKSAPSIENIERVSNTFPWKIDSMGCHPVLTQTLNISEETGDMSQLHKVRWKYEDGSVNDSIDFWVRAEYETKEMDGKIHSIQNVKITIEIPEETEKYFVHSEINSLIDYCIANANLPLFFETAAKMIKKWQERLILMKRYKLERSFVLTSAKKRERFEIIFADALGHEIVWLFWAIAFHIENLSIEETIGAKFSRVGQTLAKSYNFPEELMSTGKYPSWSPKEYISNITKMVSLTNCSFDESNMS